jgi:hypothetical protein
MKRFAGSVAVGGAAFICAFAVAVIMGEIISAPTTTFTLAAALMGT